MTMRPSRSRVTSMPSGARSNSRRSNPPSPGLIGMSAAQPIEQALLRGVVARGVLGVPLHCEQGRAVELERFDDAVAIAGRDAQAVAHRRDRLVVVAGAARDVGAHHLL